MNFQCECLSTVKDEIGELLQQHYEEIALHKDRIPLDPDWDRYFQIENAGALEVYTARDVNELVGYAAFFVQPHMHYKSTIFAVNDVLFLRKDLRKGLTGIRFIRFCDAQLEERGVDRIVWHVKKANDWTPILSRMGYKEDEIMMGRLTWR